MNHAYVDAHTNGIEKALSAAECFSSISSIAAETGLEIEDIETFYQWFNATQKTVTVFSQGVNQSVCGTDKVNSILNCHLATGRIGQPGSTPFSITGQPNAMGGREVGGLANTLAAHLEFGNDAHTDLLKTFWDSPQVATKPGLKAVDMFDAIERGDIKAVWIMATNPVVSLPDSKRIRTILDNCPLVVVSDCMEHTDTMQFANVKLPAQGWSEKSGTVTNSERRISRQRRLLPTPGQGMPDWWIVCEVAKRMGFDRAFTYRSEVDIFNEYVAQTALGNKQGEPTKRKLNLEAFGELSNEEYQHLAPIQWPHTLDHEVKERIFSNGQFSTSDSRACFVPVAHQSLADKQTSTFNMRLLTGRLRDQWHTMTRTGLSASLNALDIEPYVLVHPDDAKSHHIADGQLVQITSRSGQQIFKARISTDVSIGQCFVPIHWSETHSNGGKPNTLIAPKIDPISGQPEFKAAAINLQAIKTPFSMLLATVNPQSTQTLNRLKPIHWVKQTVDGGYVYHLYFEAVPVNLLNDLAPQLFGSNHSSLLSSNTKSRSGIIYTNKKPNAAYVLFDAQFAACQPDIAQLLASSFDDVDIHAFLSGELSVRSPTICTCKQVKQEDIEIAFLEEGACSVEKICEMTQAGTGCGNCVSEVGRCVNQLLIDTPFKDDCIGG
ncbi:assimilatory nitrate reductase catalytic subunit [Enterovibrio nigricans DSM 22720]|uniref:Assimilatory nitrate reductase catalytic subunit n=1 Tax=Enterovibrio nigricans DSM 22720 TaxID=1121868 RepID=A0A1T4UWT8_9GAMM|nr:assimilatory nitrate reductase catalytic subunit [Enterovibrio nigricans DSM 22720]